MVVPILFMAYISGGGEFLSKVFGDSFNTMLLLGIGMPAATLVIGLFLKGIEKIIKR